MASGFGEVDAVAGKVKEQRMVAAAHKAGMRIVGPNSQGLANFGTGAIASFSTMFMEFDRAEGHVARPRSRRQGGRGRAIWSQRSGCAKAVSHDLIEAEVGHEGDAARGIEVDGVRVGAFLPALVRARSLVAHDRDRGGELSIGADGKHRHGASAVVGHEQESS